MFKPRRTALWSAALMLTLIAALNPVHGVWAQEEDSQAMDKKAAEPASGDKVTVIQTTLGEITLRLYPDVAPKAVENFLTHAENGYYDGVIFHRIIKGFMMQGGDPTGTGFAGKSIWEKPFEDEISKDHVFDRRGILAMANAGPRTNGSQFFITFKATPWLNGKHTIFGEVIDGWDVLDKVEAAETGPGDKPVVDIAMESIKTKASKAE